MNSALENEINALLDLLDDPDYKVFESVRNRFLQIGIEANYALENAWSMTLDEVYQKRVESILEEISKNHASTLVENWIKSNPNDILDGYLIFSKFQYPNLKQENVFNSIEHITKDIWLEINNQLTSLEKIRIINHILFQILAYKPNNLDITNTKYYYLNHLLERKLFVNSSISLLYLIIAQKLDIPIYGILFKQTPLLCFADRLYDDVGCVNQQNILFYIDAYNGGNVLSKDKLSLIGSKLSVPASPLDYLPVTPVALILNTVNQVIQAEKANDNIKKVEDLTHFAKLLQKTFDF